MAAIVRAYDPVARTEASKILPDIEYADDEYAAVTRADALIFVTEWNQFRALGHDSYSRLDEQASYRRPPQYL